ncbi:MAG: hypothetical protein ACJ74Z_23520 [Bryobacteraceae bacterium]
MRFQTTASKYLMLYQDVFRCNAAGSFTPLPVEHCWAIRTEVRRHVAA